MFDTHTISIVNKSVEGIIGVKFVDKLSDFSFVIFACYLPLKTSSWGQNDVDFFGHLISMMYIHHDGDANLVCGDMNACICDCPDVIDKIDNIPERQVLDNVKEGHYKSLLEFINDARLCVLNGRVTSEQQQLCMCY